MTFMAGLKASLKLMFGKVETSKAADEARQSAQRVQEASREFIKHQDTLGNLVNSIKESGARKPRRGKR